MVSGESETVLTGPPGDPEGGSLRVPAPAGIIWGTFWEDRHPGL